MFHHPGENAQISILVRPLGEAGTLLVKRLAKARFQVAPFPLPRGKGAFLPTHPGRTKFLLEIEPLSYSA